MAKRIVIWSKIAKEDLSEIINYYNYRNKSKTYSAKLFKEIKLELATLNLTTAMPQKTTIQFIHYFTYNHISVFFSFEMNTIEVKYLIDERRNPNFIASTLTTKT